VVEQEYASHQVDQPGVSCRFLYPADWRARESVEDSSTEVFIAGPRSQAGTYTISLTVKASPMPEQTPELAATSLLSRYRNISGFRELGRASGMVAGCPAVEVDFAYSMPLPLNSINPKWTVIRQRRVFLKRGEQLYELRYAAPEEDYETWLEAFRTLVQSFAFLEEPVSRVAYRPIITAAPQCVREETMEYGVDRGGSDEESEHHEG
jgi:hypothetical protein